MAKKSPKPLDRAIDALEGKWKLRILGVLMEGAQRNSELMKRLDSISQKMLAQKLRELERDGIVKRTVYPEVPPRVEYELTKSGQKIKPLLMMLEQWGEGL